MLTFEKIGYYGRLGNQMFQYAALVGFAEKSGLDYGIPYRNQNKLDVGDYTISLDLTNYFNLSCKDSSFVLPKKALIEDENLTEPVEVPDETTLHGYFQSENFFQHVEDKIRDEFDFNKETRNTAKPLLPDGVLVSLHVRRTDYTKFSHVHTNLGMDYYKEAMQHFDGYRPVVFSDDVEWCKNEMSWLGDDAVYMNNDAGVDMLLMSYCNAHIIANSSFSWWGSYLGQGKTIAPKKWYAEQGPKEWQSIYRKDWIVL